MKGPRLDIPGGLGLGLEFGFGFGFAFAFGFGFGFEFGLRRRHRRRRRRRSYLVLSCLAVTSYAMLLRRFVCRVCLYPNP